MNYVIVAQGKNVGNIIKDWLLYHHENGFSFMYYDDKSTDNTIKVIDELREMYSIDIQTFRTNNTSNIGRRIIDSYNNAIGKLSQDTICAFIDIDEFLVWNKTTLIDCINNTMSSMDTDHLYVHSFDVDDGFISREWYTTQPVTKSRWDYLARKKTIFQSRGKSIIKRPNTEIKYSPNAVHSLCELYGNDYDRVSVEEYDTIRIHHFRKPTLSNIKLVEDPTLFDKMVSIKRKYEST